MTSKARVVTAVRDAGLTFLPLPPGVLALANCASNADCTRAHTASHAAADRPSEGSACHTSSMLRDSCALASAADVAGVEDEAAGVAFEAAAAPDGVACPSLTILACFRRGSNCAGKRSSGK